MTRGIVFGNRILDVVAIACFAAQFYKVFSPMFKGEKAQWIRLFQTGGMPSSHASTVVSLVTSIAMLKGVSSIEFAIAMVFAGIVLYDATGIRRAAGEQAKALNKLLLLFQVNNQKILLMEYVLEIPLNLYLLFLFLLFFQSCQLVYSTLLLVRLLLFLFL